MATPHKCLRYRSFDRRYSRDLDLVQKGIRSRNDTRLMLSIRKACGLESTNWFNRKSFYHRWFLRQLYAEAHTRGLDVPEFNWKG